MKMLLERFGIGRGFPQIAPDQDLAIIGDIHGCARQLSRAIASVQGAQIICVGDYIDRGEDSAAVLRMLYEAPEIICLMGNHEDMLIQFLDQPTKSGSRWLRYGGLQTLASFGISQVAETLPVDKLVEVRDKLRAVMGDDLENWLRSLPSYWQSGNVAVTHAGADPLAPVGQQKSQTLRWGHPSFNKTKRRDGIWIVHGHVVVDNPTIQSGRVNIDTGAYATGRLSMAKITGGSVTFEAFDDSGGS